VEPLRGVGEPSEVMLKLMVAELGCGGRWYRSERLQRSPGYMMRTRGYEKQLEYLRVFCNVQIRCRTEARFVSFGDVYGQG
jgi:hypothetical protein